MAQFEFRLRFHLREGDRIEEPAEEIVITENSAGQRLRLKSGELGKPIKERSRAALIGGPYPTPEEARTAAEGAKRSLLIWAIRQRLGIDLGDGKARSGFTDYGRRWLEERVGGPVRNDVHGIDIYERDDGLKFVSLNMSANLGTSSKNLSQIVGAEFAQPTQLTDKQVVAAELYCSSFFDVSPRTRLVTLVSSVEAVLELQERPPEAVQLVETFKAAVNNGGLDLVTRSSLLGSLERLRRESIGQAGRRLAKELLGEREYAGTNASKFYSDCYELRSQIVHDGYVHDRGTDLPEVANALSTFVADLLLASFGSRAATSVTGS
jgi:hypothetical protein